MKAQKYKILGSGSETNTNIQVGQFVSKDNTDSLIRGYISAIHPCSFDIVLFEPDDIPDDTKFVVIHERMTQEEVVDELLGVLVCNREMLPLWNNILRNSN